MELSLAIPSFFLLIIAYGECSDTPMSEEEMHRCYSILICEKDKIEEFYEISAVAGPENSQRYVNFINDHIHLKDPANTLEFWIYFKDKFCEWTKEAKQKGFNDWCALVGQHMLDVCVDPASKLCLQAESAADQFSAALTKYKAMGLCDGIDGPPTGMAPGGMPQMASPFG